MIRLTLIAASVIGLVMALPAFAQDSAPGNPVNTAALLRSEQAVQKMSRNEMLDLVLTHATMLNPAPRGDWNEKNGAAWTPKIPSANNVRLLETDGSIGVGDAADQSEQAQSTAYPSSISDSASWDPDLMNKMGEMVGHDTAAKGFNVLLSGGVNLIRDPRGGRNFEYLGEDPLLTGVMAASYVQGVQSQHVVATIKHFALNNYETSRATYDVSIDKTAAMESDLLAFGIAIHDGQPGAVMCSYNLVWGQHSCENKFLLTDILRGQWNYQGWVMSDWGAVHSTIDSVQSGLDQESGAEMDPAVSIGGNEMLKGTTPTGVAESRLLAAQKSGKLLSDTYFSDPLRNALRNGKVSDQQLRNMAKHILYGLFASGAADHPNTQSPMPRKEGLALAERASEEGIVLLKNQANSLPLPLQTTTLAVIGSHADKGVLAGGGSPSVLPYGGNAVPTAKFSLFDTQVWDPSAPLTALHTSLPSTSIRFDDGDSIAEAVKMAGSAERVVIFAHQWSREGTDLPSLDLPGNQDALIDAVAKVNPKTTVVLETMGPVKMPWLKDVASVVEAWYPGARGGEAIANVLVGSVNPSGRLPQTFPVSESDLPRPNLPSPPTDAAGAAKPFKLRYAEGENVGYKWFSAEKKPVLFPFGYGLSYTKFTYSHLHVRAAHGLEATFDVTNSGSLKGADVPQLYLDDFAAGDRKIERRLIGWKRVTLAPGETKQLTIPIRPVMLATYDEMTKQWTIAKWDYIVRLGSSSADTPLSAGMALPKSILPAGAEAMDINAHPTPKD